MQSSLSAGTWPLLISRLSAVVDLEATAREFKAIQRRGKIRDAASLLRLILMYAVGHLSLRATAAAAEGVIATLSDKAVEGRLRKSGDWLEHLLCCLLRHKATVGSLSNLALVDGTIIKPPGQGGQWRVHARYDPALGRFADLHLSPLATAEAVAHTMPDAGQTVITDRGYARVRNFLEVLQSGADFLTRIGWRSLQLRDAHGQAFDLFAHLPQTADAVEHAVYIPGVKQPLRLILQRLPDGKQQRARKKARRKSERSCHRLDPRTETAAGYLMLLTSLPADKASPTRLVEMYGARWQIELSFKRLKTLGGIDKLPSADPKLARTWLLAHLIVAVLNDELAGQIVGFSPSETS